MIGIKGVGMTMLAQYLVEKGYNIIGSDVLDVFMTDEVLQKYKIKVFNNFDVNNIPNDIDLIIYSTAYNESNNAEVEWALKSKVPILTYAQALGETFESSYGIAVVGSHGKTTTSAWLGYVMEKSGLSPSVMVGAKVHQFNGNSIVGDSDYLVIEADEYQNKLQYCNPEVVLLNNIDYDHIDYFKTEKAYEQVFIDFVKKIPSDGFLIANYDDEKVRNISKNLTKTKVISYAINNSANYIAYNIRQKGNEQYFFVKSNIDNKENDLGEFCISLFGKHNIYNALAVISTSIEFKIDLLDIRMYLKKFKGTKRRMDIMGKFNGALVVDDYAHHPTEIATTLAGAREVYKDKNIITVFHPHTFTRTKEFINEFADSFQNTDELIVLDIYGSAREKQGGVHSKDLIKKIKEKNINLNIKYLPKLEDVENYLRDTVTEKDLVLLMGAGDVFKIGENLVV